MLIDHLLYFIQVLSIIMCPLLVCLFNDFLSLVDCFLISTIIFKKSVEAASWQDGGCAVIPGLGTFALLSPLTQLLSLPPEAEKLLIFSLKARKFEVMTLTCVNCRKKDLKVITLRKNRSNFPLFFSKLNRRFSAMCWITPDMEFLILHSICSPPKLSAAAETLHAVCRITFNWDPSLSTSSLVTGLVIWVFFCIREDVIRSISFLIPSSTEFLFRRCPPSKLSITFLNGQQIANFLRTYSL